MSIPYFLVLLADRLYILSKDPSASIEVVYYMFLIGAFYAMVYLIHSGTEVKDRPITIEIMLYLGMTVFGALEYFTILAMEQHPLSSQRDFLMLLAAGALITYFALFRWFKH